MFKKFYVDHVSKRYKQRNSKQPETSYENMRISIATRGISFSNTMNLTHAWLCEEKDLEGKIQLLDFILDVIREDLKMDVLSTMLYKNEHFPEDLPPLLIPSHYKDENGREFKVYPNEEDVIEREVSLFANCVLVMPWDRKRMRTAIKALAYRPFEYKWNNHMAYYFTHIDICYAHNGCHSIGAGVGYKKGMIKATEVDISRLFTHVSANSSHWYNTHTKEIIDDVFDFRLGIIYKLAKRRYMLLNDIWTLNGK